MGADLARRLHRDATAPAAATPPANEPQAAPAADIAVAFDRIARCIRRTVLLAQRVAEPARPIAAREPGPDAGQRRVAARKQIIREVEDAIGRTERGTRAEALHAELLDRLDAPDLDDDILHRPVADIIADIQRDLGLAAAYGVNPWKRRSPVDIATLHARAARPVAPSPGPVAVSDPGRAGDRPPKTRSRGAAPITGEKSAPARAGIDPPTGPPDRAILLPYARRLRDP